MVTDGVHQLSICLVGGGPYGVRLSGGGQREPLRVAKMHRRSKAMASGVEVGDILLAVNGQHCRHWTTDQVMDAINNSPGDVTLYLLRNSRDTHQVDAAFDSFVRQSNDERIVGNSTQRNLDQFNTTTPALYDRRHQHGEGTSAQFSSQLSITSGDPAATPGEYARRHISAVYYQASPSASVVADMRQNHMNNNGRSWAATEPVRAEEVPVLPKFTPSRAADFGDRRNEAQPLMWRPPSSLLAPKPPFAERPVSAPPYRGQPLPVPPSWNDHDNDGGQLLEPYEQRPDMDTEVVIWSSKVQHSPPPPTYDHAMWTMRTSHQQPGVSWVPQHEPEPIPVSSEVDFSSVTSLNRAAAEYNGDDAGVRPRSTPPEPPPRRRFLQRQTDRQPAAEDTTPQSVDWGPPPLDQPPPDQLRGLGPRWPSSPALGAHAQPRNISGEEEAPLFLRRVVVAGDEDDDVIDDVSAYGLKRKKMFADSSFYEDPDQKYPTIAQQVKMARRVAQLLTSPSGPSGRGQQMFLKRQQMSSNWKPESAPQVTPRRPPRRPGYFSDAEELPRSRSTPVIHTATEVEELERLQTRAEKSRHDLVPPQLGARLAAELQSTSTQGGSTVAGRMFARRRDRAERSVVPEVPAGRRVRHATPPETVVHAPPPNQRGGEQPKVPTISKHRQPNVVIDKPEVDSTQTDDPLSYPVRGARLAKMIEVPRAAMTPWEAAAQFGGRVDHALEHIDAYRAAATHVTLDDFVDDDEEMNEDFAGTPAEPFTQPPQPQPMSLSYPGPPAASYGVFDNHHGASSGDIYSQYNPTPPYDYYNYDNNSSLQDTTSTAVAGGTIDINHRSDMSFDRSRDAISSGGAWQPTAGRTAHQPAYRPVKFYLPY